MSPSRPTPPPISSHLQRHRPVLFVVLVVFLVFFSGVSLAQEAHEEAPWHGAIDRGLDHGLVVDPPLHSPHDHTVSPANSIGSIQFDAVTPLRHDPPRIAVTRGNRSNDSRPVSVDLYASLANFDADSDPDGWRAQVVLRNRDGHPVVMRSYATFELVPRIPLSANQNIRHHHFESMKWSKPLRYDQRGVAHTTLPLRRELQAIYGWNATSPSDPFGTFHSGRHSRFTRSRLWDEHSILGATWREQVTIPATGILKVRVSVPTEGVYEAVSTVRLRPVITHPIHW